MLFRLTDFLFYSIYWRTFSFSRLNFRGPLCDMYNYRLRAAEDLVLGKSFVIDAFKQFSRRSVTEGRKTTFVEEIPRIEMGLKSGTKRNCG